MKAERIRIKGRFSRYALDCDGKGGWIACDDMVIESARIGTFTIPRGALNDLASIPRAVRSIITVNGPHRVGAIIHDYLYAKKGKLPECDITREEADAVFYDAMRMSRNDYYGSLRPYEQLALIRADKDTLYRSNEQLVGDITAHTMWSAVRAGGWVYWNR